MAEPKTKATTTDPAAFIAAIPDAGRRADCEALVALLQEVTGEPPVMWGDSIVGFGKYRYRYESGQTGEWPLAGFSPRKQALTVYLSYGFDKDGEEMARLGKVKTGKACLYIKRLSDVDLDLLREMIRRSVAQTAALYPATE